MQQALPVINAFLICDKIIKESGTNKNTLVGIFDIVKTSRFPSVHGELWVYVNLSDVLAEHKSKLELVYLDESKTVGQGIGTLRQSKEPSQELAFCFRNLVFEKEGTYTFRFWVDDEVLGEKHFYVTKSHS